MMKFVIAIDLKNFSGEIHLVLMMKFVIAIDLKNFSGEKYSVKTIVIHSRYK
jgi:hypothetical protein